MAAIQEDPEAAGVVGELEPPWVDPSGRYLHFQVPTVHEYGTPEAMDFARRLRSDIVPAPSSRPRSRSSRAAALRAPWM